MKTAVRAWLPLVLVPALLMFSLRPAHAQVRVRIHGTVTDFRGAPLDNVTVHVKDEKFNNLYSARSGKDGRYEILVPPGMYFCLYAIREGEYKKTSLEYWAWNVPALSDIEINPQYEKLEIYAVNAFKPQVTPYDTFMVYFRPMSLSWTFKNYGPSGQVNAQPGDTIDIAPPKLEEKDLDIRINGGPAKVVSITKLKEYARGNYLVGYLVQCVAPADTRSVVDGFDVITVKVTDPATGDTGRADYFYRR